MADKDLNDKKYDAINPESIINVPINGKFFGDIRAMFISLLLKDRDKKQMGQVLSNIQNNKVSNEEEYQIYILFYLLVNIEHHAKKQGFIIKESVPKDANEDLPDLD